MNVEKKRRLAARTEMMLIGNLLMGTAVDFLRMSRFGTDPFTCMNLGVSGTLRIQFGTYQLLVNVLLFLLVLVKAKDCIGAGTIVNMAGIGYIADIIVVMLTKAVGDVALLPMAVRVMIMAGAVVLCSFAAAMYMEANMGIAVYDALAVIIERKTGGKIPFKIARVATDFVCVIVGFAFGSIVGVATVITAAFMGPLIQWFQKNWIKKVIEKV